MVRLWCAVVEGVWCEVVLLWCVVAEGVWCVVVFLVVCRDIKGLWLCPFCVVILWFVVVRGFVWVWKWCMMVFKVYCNFRRVWWSSCCVVVYGDAQCV